MHGVPLPRTGTFESRVLSTVIFRERAEKYAFARLLTKLLGPFSGISDEGQYLMLTEYAEELFQLRYNSKYVPVLRQRLRKKRDVRQEELRLLQKVSAMTVEST